jgi:hypothetical protein
MRRQLSERELVLAAKECRGEARAVRCSRRSRR